MCLSRGETGKRVREWWRLLKNPSAPDARLRWSQLLTLLAPQSGERILDIGCGRGLAARAIVERVGGRGQVIGIERQINQPEQDGFPVLGADAQALPFPDATFDAVLCVNVLEAVPRRAHALDEMYRVLKPGGRALVAHDDYESQVYACSDRELGRRIGLAYAQATFTSYATSDGQMGRHLWGLFSAAGFRNPVLSVLPLVNTEYREPWHGWVLSQFPADFVAPVSNLTDDELERWRTDLAERSARGVYAYCLNLYVCRGWK